MPRVALYPVQETEDAEDDAREALQCPFVFAAFDAWYEGRMSGNSVQHLAHMVTLNPTHHGIAELAALGGAGANRNTSRDLNRWCDRSM